MGAHGVGDRLVAIITRALQQSCVSVTTAGANRVRDPFLGALGGGLNRGDGTWIDGAFYGWYGQVLCAIPAVQWSARRDSPAWMGVMPAGDFRFPWPGGPL